MSEPEELKLHIWIWTHNWYGFVAVYLWRKVVLFCSYEIHQTGMLQIVFLVSLESYRQEGMHALGFMTFVLVVQKFLNIEWFLH